ncbi:hypothetical protein CPB83DRAFT_232255 [Crepidotus variabilis]|uniref:CxC6 like cysteine cluster associated with KDZ domain-containing protein n=1 Tax=Crepidotus variabilis TaxID=179855 RepID=A0A9P6ETX3_9AGAR|nr:hypothetical protein CPB83DRAFT_232255 [Crepidotus variabilis]
MSDHVQEKSVLELPHQAESQAKRLQAAPRVRNQRLAGIGREAWNHACNRCCHIEQREDGKFYQIRSTISDGISLERPCCAVHDCKEPLESGRLRCHFGGGCSTGTQRLDWCNEGARFLLILALIYTPNSQRFDMWHKKLLVPSGRDMANKCIRHI